MAGSPSDFYVGYLGLPPTHARFLRVAVPVALWLLAILAGLVVWRARAAGDAVWETANEREWTGVLSMEPYPVLYTAPDADSGATAWLVVQMNKVGAHRRLEGYAGRSVVVRGFRLRREGRTMIELGPDDPATEGDDSVTPINTLAAVLPPASERLGESAFSGEIVDGKCYLGAMKPGDGQGHKACATLCVRGGLPPLLATRGEDGSLRMILLSFGGSSAMPESGLGLIAEPVEVSGTLTRRGSLEVLETSIDRIRVVD